VNSADTSKTRSHNGQHTAGRRSLLDAGALPVEELAILAKREGRRPRPIYQAHRWFARRFGCVSRSLLTAALLAPDAEFWTHYYEGVDWSGALVLDPFVGGGTSVVEALRLGASIIGIDVDAVACAITRFETHLHSVPNLEPTLMLLQNRIGEQMAQYYSTVTPEGETRQVLHYFWVQVVECSTCHAQIEAHPHFQLGYEAEGTKQWAFCPSCHAVQELDREVDELHCEYCNLSTPIQQGPVHYGRLTCPFCNTQERLIDVASRTNTPPAWRLFAMETMEPPLRKRLPLVQRRFRAVTPRDQKVFEAAKRALMSRQHPDGTLPWVPNNLIPTERRADDRLIQYGYRRYFDLFNERQLLHLSLLAEAVDGLEGSIREAMAIAFSDHLTTNCMMTQYAFGWRRLSPLFSIRAYRHVTRPVEINPWVDGTGRGTFPNAVRQVQCAIDAAKSPKEPILGGGFRVVKDSTSKPDVTSSPTGEILHRSADNLDVIADDSVDFVLTDPPYFDNIAYSELSDFFVPWLQQLDLVPQNCVRIGLEQNLAANGRDNKSLEEFERALRNCFMEVVRVLKPDGRLVFTYQHRMAGAWHALACALNGIGLQTIQIIPLLGDSGSGIHKQRKTSSWDAVFVMKKEKFATSVAEPGLSSTMLDAARSHWRTWCQRLEDGLPCRFTEADRANLYRACLTACALGLFEGHEETDRRPLSELLEEIPPNSE